MAVHYDQRPKDREADSQADEADSNNDLSQCRSLGFFSLRIRSLGALEAEGSAGAHSVGFCWSSRLAASLPRYAVQTDFGARVSELTKRVKIFPYPEGCTRKGGSRDESKRRAFAWRRGYSLHTAQNITKPFSHASWTKPSSGEHNSRKHDGKWHRSNEKPEHRVVSLSSADGAEKQEGQSEGKGAHVVLAVIGPFQGRRIPSRLVRKSA